MDRKPNGLAWIQVNTDVSGMHLIQLMPPRFYSSSTDLEGEARDTDSSSSQLCMLYVLLHAPNKSSKKCFAPMHKEWSSPESTLVTFATSALFDHGVTTPTAPCAWST